MKTVMLIIKNKWLIDWTLDSVTANQQNSDFCFDAIKKKKGSNTMTHLSYKDFHQICLYCILIRVLFSPNFGYSVQFINITSLLKQQQCSLIYCNPVEHLSYKPLTSLMSSHCFRLGNKHNFGRKNSMFTSENTCPHE